MERIQRYAGCALLTFLAVMFVVVYAPTFSFAQESSLSGTIRAALLADPRSQGLSAEQLNGLVESLTTEAENEGITAKDIVWRPEAPEPEVAQETTQTCGNLPTFLCMLNESLGFSSGNLAIPILLFLASAALLFVLGLMVKMHSHTPESIGGMR